MLNPIFTEIKTKLNKIYELEAVEWYRGQDTSKGGLIVSPAAFIKFDTLKMEHMANKAQEIKVGFEVILCLSNFEANEDIDKSPHFEIEKEIYEALTDKGFKSLSSIHRTEITPYHDNPSIFKTTQKFEAMLWEE